MKHNGLSRTNNFKKLDLINRDKASNFYVVNFRKFIRF